jgi:hypothetical protein
VATGHRKPQGNDRGQQFDWLDSQGITPASRGTRAIGCAP